MISYNLVLLCAILIAACSAQDYCDQKIDSFNASGIFTYHVDYPTAAYAINSTGDSTVPEPSWAITVDEQDNAVQKNLWFSTGGQNYSDDITLGYDVCAFYIQKLRINTVELGQNDPGDCSSTLSEQCRTAILQRAAASAFSWVQYASPPPYSNLSAGVLPTICSYIAGDLGDHGYVFPKECSQDLDYKAGVDNPAEFDVRATSVALTGYNSTGLNMDCPMQVGDKTYYHLTDLQEGSDTYDSATRNIYPVLSVWMPLANIDRTWSESYAQSKLICARVKNFSEGSRVSPALPSGTPYDYSRGLSKGAIAGIVVGVAVFALLVIGLAACIFIKRRRQRRLRDNNNQGAAKWAQLDGTEVGELSAVERRFEPNSEKDVVEMDAAQGKPAELGT